ncbi:hypothetical protein [Mesorhizobium sp.]|uniref:hypothetical protein n=1 Tax=Mesorhizobium sp. TaxID=1871066 RepID=UPI000FE98C1E|nr:hypothetical protein [Mesorhizobium sp.]RWO89544.1 MAG: hypothetical protein EOQ96_05130 [Mesorhizobium sp.]
MRLHELATRLDAQERRLSKIGVLDGDDNAVRHITICTIPSGRFLLVAGVDDEIVHAETIHSTSVYEVERAFVRKELICGAWREWVEHETILVPHVAFAYDAVLVDAPEAPTMRTASVEITHAAHLDGVSQPLRKPMDDKDALAMIEAARAKRKAAKPAEPAPTPVAKDKPFSVRGWAAVELSNLHSRTLHAPPTR